MYSDVDAKNDESRKVDEDAMRRVRSALAASGVDVLFNEERILVRNGGRLRVAGFGDLWSHQFDARAFRAAPGEPTLVLSHNPDTAPELAERGAGHWVACWEADRLAGAPA